MCGIAGVVGRDGSPELTGRVEQMRLALRHRGPDDSGTWLAPGKNAAFAHTRLSVLDRSAAGHQPMSLPDGRYTITYNGEIYNFPALRQRLADAGVEFHSQSDTEVILRMYEAHGPACLEQLRGMFALAIWDNKEQTCFLARDRFGVKQLYYQYDNGSVAFASELRALAVAVPRQLNRQAVFQFFLSGSVPEPLTLVDGLQALEAGHYLLWRDGQVDIRQYWQVEFSRAEVAPDPAALTRAALIDSVKHHFVSDVPVGVLLSGGVDSTAILALARISQPGELHTFTLTFPGTPMDEGPTARRTAALFGTIHHECAVDGRTARQILRDFLEAVDQPSIDGFNIFAACRLAKAHGAKVILSGLGGDELFGGYPSFREVPRLLKWGLLARRGGPLSAGVLSLAGRVGGPKWRRLADLIDLPPDLESAYGVFRGIFSRSEARVLAQHYSGESGPMDVRAQAREGASTPLDHISQLELTRYTRNQLLRDADVMSMASGVELRVPFLDCEVFDTLAHVPAEQRLAEGKALLLSAVPEIPSWVAGQTKRGFLFPFQHWLDEEWAGDMGAPVDQKVVAMDTWFQQWSVMAFESWLHRLGPENG